jgi:hypothetical protein
MTGKKGTAKATGTQHSQEFREEALALAERIGVNIEYPLQALCPGHGDVSFSG